MQDLKEPVMPSKSARLTKFMYQVKEKFKDRGKVPQVTKFMYQEKEKAIESKGFPNSHTKMSFGQV